MLPMPPVPQTRSPRLERAVRAGGPRRRLRARRQRAAQSRAAATAAHLHARRVTDAYTLVMGEALAKLIVELADLELRYRRDPGTRDQARQEAFARISALRERTWATAHAHLVS